MVFIRRQENALYLVSDDKIICYHLEDGTDQQVSIPQPILPENLTKDQLEVLNKEVRIITSLNFSRSGEYLAIATESKQIIVFDKHFTVIKNITAKRVPSKVCFTHSNDIVVADKTGDIYHYKLESDKDEPTLLLGHLSVVLDVIISDCGKYIITCDRDEKIRVSHFPNCYNIASYCLGHTEFVTNINLIKSTLVSASGDGTVRFWDYLNGRQLCIIDATKYIEETNLLKEFAEQMDQEKVDVTALPITDMQIYTKTFSIIAISIYKYNAIQVYTIDFTNFNYQYLTKLSFSSNFCFYLCDDLYVLTDRLCTYSFIDNTILENHVNVFDKLYDKYKQLISFGNNNISTLFKRKYDNVKEYLERKKRRIEGK